MRLYGETYTFSLFDKQFHIRDRARELGVHKHLIPLEPMQIHILNIEKTMNIAIKKQVLNDFNKGLIQLFTTESNFVLPTAVPVYLESTKDANKIRAIVNLSAYAKLSKDEFGNITNYKNKASFPTTGEANKLIISFSFFWKNKKINIM